MKKEAVWMSWALRDPSLMKGITSIEEDEAAEDLVVDAMRRNKVGEPLPQHRFPPILHAKYKDEYFKKLPEIFSADGFWAVSAACADVLRQFNLGQTSLYPVGMYQHNLKTPIAGEYFYINFGERKEAFEVSETPKVEVASPIPKAEPTGLWELSFGIENGDVAVNRSALEGVDLWLDPILLDILFLSDPLVQALKEAKLTRRFGLRKCRLV